MRTHINSASLDESTSDDGGGNMTAAKLARHKTAVLERSRVLTKWFLCIAFLLIFAVATVDMTLNLKDYHKDEDDHDADTLYSAPVVFTLADAVIFSFLTIALSFTTIRLFLFLRVLQMTRLKEKLLIACVCGLFTVSYLARTVYLVYQALAIED